jgi:hypothetical protein
MMRAGFSYLCVAYFVLSVGLGLHGFSLAQWGDVLGDARVSEVLIGKARGGRSDDWMGQLPMVLSQTQSASKFQGTSHLIHPDGHPVEFGVAAPVKSWVALFKPTLWGYFVGPDFGLSWHWQFRILVLLLGAYYFFIGFFRTSASVAAFGSLLLVHSSFFAYWSHISEPIIGFGLLIAAAGLRLLRGGLRPAQVGGLGIFLVWGMLSFGLCNLYPPFQVPMLYFVMGALLIEFRKSPTHSRLKGAFVMGVAALLALGLVGLHFYENREALRAVMGTEYPGLRVSLGGDLPFARVMLMTLLSLSGYTSIMGIHLSEVGSGFLVGFAGFLVFVLSKARWCRLRAEALFLAALTIGLGVFSFVGIPAWLARVSGLYLVPAQRMMGLWCLVNVCWLVWWLVARPELSLLRKAWVLGLTLAAVLGAGVLGLPLFAQLSPSKIAIAMFVVGVGVYLLLNRPRLGAGFVLVVTLAGTIAFNPVDRGTYERIRSSPRARELVAQFEASGKKSLLILDNDCRTANFPRLLGIPSYGGMHFVPQVAFWKTLSVSAGDSYHYNRFAHVSFRRAGSSRPTSFRSHSGDLLEVSLSDLDLARLAESTLILDSLPVP